MLGYDISETTTISIAGAEWTIGLIPLAKYDELADAVEESNRAFARHARTHTRPDEACDQCAALLGSAARKLRPTYREAVRWGLRGCDAPGIEVLTESTRLAGKDYPVVPVSMVERLARVAGGALVRRLGIAILDANRLCAKEILGFR